MVKRIMLILGLICLLNIGESLSMENPIPNANPDNVRRISAIIKNFKLNKNNPDYKDKISANLRGVSVTDMEIIKAFENTENEASQRTKRNEAPVQSQTLDIEKSFLDIFDAQNPQQELSLLLSDSQFLLAFEKDPSNLFGLGLNIEKYSVLFGLLNSSYDQPSPEIISFLWHVLNGDMSIKRGSTKASSYPEESYLFFLRNIRDMGEILKKKDFIKFIGDYIDTLLSKGNNIGEIYDLIYPLPPVSFSPPKPIVPVFSEGTYSDLPGAGEERRPYTDINAETVVEKIIYNQTNYDAGIDIFSKTKLNKGIFSKGKELTYKLDTPIGYNIYLPKTPIKAIVVEVYGGYKKTSRITNMSYPGDISEFDKYLLAQGIAVIDLNLPDFLSDYKGSQAELPSDLHALLHECIHYFWETIKNTPESLSKDLSVLKDKRIYLFGGSFGGRTAVRHSQLHPDTFDGYISHDGALSFDILAKTMRYSGLHADFRNKIKAGWNAEANPINYIDNIKQPILLLHNFDDNRVNVLVTLDWYKQAINYNSNNKQMLELYITNLGNIAPEDDHGTKGHGSPSEEQNFQKYMDTIVRFILTGKPAPVEVSRYHAHKYELLASKNYQEAEFDQRFLSYAFRFYQYKTSENYRTLVRNNQKASASKTDNSLTSHYHSSWKIFDNDSIRNKSIYYALSYVDELAKNPLLLKKVLDSMKEKKVLTDEQITNALWGQIPLYVDYLKDTYKIKTSKDDMIKKMIGSEDLKDSFRQLITGQKPNSIEIRKELLLNIYLANPELLKDYREKMEKNIIDVQRRDTLLNNLQGKIKEHEMNVRHVFQRAVKEAVTAKEAVKDTISKTKAKNLIS